MYDLDTTVSHLDQFLAGASVTLLVSAQGALLGVALGFGLLLLRAAPWRAVRWIARAYVSFIRGTPLLVQILFVYYALPGLTGLDVPAFAAGVMALGANSGAFTSEILRGGLSAIAPGQFEAACALGLSRFHTWSRVIVPQLMRLILPPLLNELTTLVKASALLSVITVVELTRTAQDVMNTTYRPLGALLVAAATYFVMLFALSRGASVMERRQSQVRP